MISEKIAYKANGVFARFTFLHETQTVYFATEEIFSIIMLV